MVTQTRLLAAATALAATMLAAYLPDVGHGFIQDDFHWIRTSRVERLAELPALFARHVGFYRPLVSTTFAADHALWGLDPRPYGLTNLLLAAAVALLLFGLARRLGLPAEAALLASGVWMFNFHGINMALLWVSGRTALLVSIFALATAHAILARRTLAAALCCLAALLCKEEAVLLPLLFGAFVYADAAPADARTRLRASAARTWPLWVALGVYAFLRTQSGAFSPADAPPYYQLSLSPAVIATNAAHYADRALTVSAAVCLVLVAAVRLRPRFECHERRVLRLAALWVPATYAITTLVPVRSSLYAVLPSLGAALAAAAVASALRRASPNAFARAAAALMILAVLLIPVYRSRNVRWVALADVTTDTLERVETAAAAHAGARRVILIDAPEERFNLAAAFGGLLPDALALTLGEGWDGAIVAPGTEPPPDVVVLRHR